MGRDSVVGIVTLYGLDGPGIESRLGGEISRTSPDRPWGPPSLLYNGYRVSFLGLKRPGCGVDHSPHQEQRLKKEYRYTSLGHPGPLQGERHLFYFYIYIYIYIYIYGSVNFSTARNKEKKFKYLPHCCYLNIHKACIHLDISTCFVFNYNTHIMFITYISCCM